MVLQKPEKRRKYTIINQKKYTKKTSGEVSSEVNFIYSAAIRFSSADEIINWGY